MPECGIVGKFIPSFYHAENSSQDVQVHSHNLSVDSFLQVEHSLQLWFYDLVFCHRQS